MPVLPTRKRDLTNKQFATLAKLQAHIQSAGNYYDWGSGFTVFEDATASNNGDYRLTYGYASTSKKDPDNLFKIVRGSTFPDAQEFDGDGVTKEFTITGDANTSIFAVDVGGNYQVKGTDYSVAGLKVTFVTAPGLGTKVAIHPVKGLAAVSEPVDLVDNLSEGGTTKALTAEQGKILANASSLTDDESNFTNGYGRWEVAAGSPSFEVTGGKLRITFNAGQNEAIRIAGIYSPNIDYLMSLKLRLVSGTAGKVVVGVFGAGAENTGNKHIIPTSTETEYEKVLTTAATTNFHIGILAADNFGQVIEIDEVQFIENFRLIQLLNESIENSNEALAVSETVTELDNYVNGDGNILDSTTSNMDGQGSWEKNLGNPGMTFSGGIMTLTFTSGNQNVVVNDILEIEKEYNIVIRARMTSGTISKVILGLFATSPDVYELELSADWTEYSFAYTAAFTYFSIGVLSADNTGGVIEVDYVQIFDKDTTIDTKITRLAKEYTETHADNAIYPNASVVFGSLTRHGKKLLKIGVLGDSLLANPLGGSIPVSEDEGSGMRPMRLTYNNVARRIYDFLSWNKATHRRLDHADWTKSGTWTPVNDGNIFEPPYPNESMYASSLAGEYVEITVPDGMENFAFICKEGTGLATLNITLNGGDISAYGSSSIDTAYTAKGHTGNPYRVVEYLGLPAGANVIRITRDGTTSDAILWGAFYWTGVTLIVQNIAHGGHTMFNLTVSHLDDEFVRNNFDAVYFEIPEMNEISLDSIESSSDSLRTILDSYLNEKEVLISSCNILGTDPTDEIPNYYETNSDPFTQKQLNSAMKKIVMEYKLPFIDLFTLFERKVIGLGGTLENGDAGQFTTDGQHGNELGVTEWFYMMRPAFKNTPINE